MCLKNLVCLVNCQRTSITLHWTQNLTKHVILNVNKLHLSILELWNFVEENLSKTGFFQEVSFEYSAIEIIKI